MARQKSVRPEIGAYQAYLAGVAKNLAMKLYGPEGMPWGTTFEELEELAVQLGQAVSRELLNQVLRTQATGSVPATRDQCPSCHQPPDPGDPGEPEPRIVTTRAGDAEWTEPHRFCPRCRRSFFPSVPELGD
jgi:hypothetical protein